MKKYLFVFIICLSLISTSRAQERLIPHFKDGLWGYINTKNKVVIDYQFEYCFPFEGNYARAVKNGKFGLIDRKGNIKTDFMYDKIDRYKKGFALFTENYDKGFLNRNGDIAVPSSFESYLITGGVGYFSEGFAIASGKVAVDTAGNAVTEKFKYRDIGICKDGRIFVYDGLKSGFIDKTGKLVIPLQYENKSSFTVFNDGVAAMKKNGKWGLIDVNGKVVCDFIYDNINSRGKGLLKVYKDKKYGFIDFTGKEIIPPQYDDAYNFKEPGLNVVFKGDQKFVINTKGESVYTKNKSDKLYIDKGVIISTSNGKFEFHDKTGKKIAEYPEGKYIKIYTGDDSFFEVGNPKHAVTVETKDRKYGLFSSDGNTLLPLEYDEIRFMNSNPPIIKVEKDWLLGLYDLKGKMLMPVVYKVIDYEGDNMFYMVRHNDEGKGIYIPGREIEGSYYEGYYEECGYYDLNSKTYYPPVNTKK